MTVYEVVYINSRGRISEPLSRHPLLEEAIEAIQCAGDCVKIGDRIVYDGSKKHG